ncbi:MAG: DNA primase [Patescibacteria group bacterium]
MNDQVEEVKSKTDIVSVIGERIELKKAGRNFKANCPFHGERTASFMVSPELQIFKCFGCAKGGDVFTFLEEFEGMDFPEALKYLADKVGVRLKSFKQEGAGEKEKLIEIHSQALRFYNYLLLNHELGKKPLEYLLKDRGLKKQTIEEFQLGYSPDNPLFLRKFLVDKKRFALSDVEKVRLGMFSGRIIFPLFDHRGNPIGFSGRVLPWDKRETGKYINSPETPIYHKSSVLYGLNLTRQFIKKKGIAIIVEGELDVISSYQAGIKNITAIKGSALTEDQVRLLSRFAPKFILALDADLAGDSAARRGITVATSLGIEVKVARMKDSKDPDEAARHDLEGYKKSLINSVGVWDFLIDSTFARYDEKSGDGSAKISKELSPILAEIEDKIVQAHYSGVVAKRLGVPIEAVFEEVSKSRKNTSASTVPELTKVEKRDRRVLLEERLLALSFQSDPNFLLQKDIFDLITTSLNKRILEEYEKFSGKHKVFDLTKFSEHLPGELFNGFTELVLKDPGEEMNDPADLKKELDLVSKELRILIVKQKLKDLANETKNLEESGDNNKLLKAQNKFNKLAQTLSKLDKKDIGIFI